MKTNPIPTAKQTLKDIMTAFCFHFQNTQKVIKMAKIENPYNGQKGHDEIVEFVLNQINEESAKEIVNKIPFPFVENYHPEERPTQEFFKNYAENRDSFYWTEQVLFTDYKKGVSIISKITGCGIHLK